MKDVYYLFIDPKHSTAELRYQSTTTEISGNIIQHINLSRPTIVFTNLMSFIKNLYPGGECTGKGYMKFGIEETLEYKYGQTTFKNIVPLLNGNAETVLKEIYPDLPMTEAMETYILSISKDPTKVKYTLGYHVKKNFYEDIADELWNFKKEHKAYYYDLNTYNDMMVANKAGALSDVHAFAEDVLFFDKKSAYPSVMVNDDKFPIGQMRCTKFNKFNEYTQNKIMDYIQNGKYFKLVVDYIIPGFEEFFDTEANKTGLEYYNFLDIQEDGKLDIFFNNIKDGRLYYCTETGRLPYVFREKLMKRYNEKEQKGLSKTAKFFKKTSLNLLFGKGIQRYDFKTKQDVQKHYKGRGENYLNPEQALHCHAAVLYEIHKAIRNNISVYWDTDGIKVKDTPEAREYFTEQNNIIQHKNLEAGFESDIGTWKLEDEAQEFISFGGKRYIWQNWDEEYHIKWSGVTQENQQKMMEELGDDKILNALINPFHEIVQWYIIDERRVGIATKRIEIKYQKQ